MLDLQLPKGYSDFEKCQPKDEDDLPTDNRYFLSEASSITWSQARGQCKLRGLGWDLAVIGDSRGIIPRLMSENN